MLQIDRSTVYRMAEAGQLPAMKVGKQWRFPSDQFQIWFQAQVAPTAVPQNHRSPAILPAPSRELGDLLSWDWLRIIQETFANLLGVMIVVTDIDGRPINQPTNPCGLFTAVSQQTGAMSKFIEGWRGLATAVDLTPAFRVGRLGLLSARSMIAVGTELKGMVIAGCIAPEKWPPSPDEVTAFAHKFGVSPDLFRYHAEDVYILNDEQRARVLATIPQIATLIAHIVDERKILIERLEAIAKLTRVSAQ
jgi:excisionase family DNA binding protein